jgi:diaminopimelate decarboxylase
MTRYETKPSLRCAVTPRVDHAIWPLTTTIDERGRLCIGDMPLTEIADEFRTPTYVIDEADFRHRIRRYGAALPGVRIVYSGKSLLTTALAQWVADEGLDLDVCSTAELATALSAGVDPNRIIMHGNAKTPDALGKAAAVGVGRIVVDSPIDSGFVAGGVAGGVRRAHRRSSPAGSGSATALPCWPALPHRFAGDRSFDLSRSDPPDDPANGRRPRSARRDDDC